VDGQDSFAIDAAPSGGDLWLFTPARELSRMSTPTKIVIGTLAVSLVLSLALVVVTGLTT
jgi:hypothetical protein